MHKLFTVLPVHEDVTVCCLCDEEMERHVIVCCMCDEEMERCDCTLRV